MTDETVLSELDDDTFDEAEAEALETEVTEEAEKVESTEEEEGKEEPEADEEEEETTASEQESVPKKALLDERRKRQEAEKERDELKQKVSQPVPNDEFDALVKASSRLMRKHHEDYPEMEKLFMELVSETDGDGKISIANQKLYRDFRNSEDPAEFAYNAAKKHKEFQEKTSPDYEKSLRDQIRKELEAEMKKQMRSDAVLPNLTTTAASANNTEQPEPLGDDDGIWD